ncbi:MAG: hypothetical protein AAFP28_06185 [Pseudomonadota bacterium]
MRALFSAFLIATAAPAAADYADPPALRGDSGYLINVETAVFEGPVDQVSAALQSPETGVLAHVTNTDRIPVITGMEPLVGAFPDAEAVRRLAFSDGSEVVERVIENSSDRFANQVWGFTSANGRALSHIRGEFKYEALGPTETLVTWEYAIAPRLFLVRPFVRSFLTNDFAPFMESGLQGAAAAFNARVSG